MILKWGDYSFQDNSIQFTVVQQSVLGKTGRRLYKKIAWDVWGYLKAADAAALTAALTTFENNMGTDDQTIQFLDNNSNPTIHVINTGETLNGVRVRGGPDYTPGLKGQWSANTEYFNRRSFRLRFEAEVPAVEGSGVVLFREVARVIAPGIPDFVVQEALTGLPQRQETCEVTKWVAQQRGIAIGFNGPIEPTLPLWSTYHMKPRPYEYEVGTPLEFGINQGTNYESKWLYSFESAIPLGILFPPTPPL